MTYDAKPVRHDPDEDEDEHAPASDKEEKEEKEEEDADELSFCELCGCGEDDEDELLRCEECGRLHCSACRQYDEEGTPYCIDCFDELSEEEEKE